MRKSYVYKIVCKITGEFYFGSSFRANSDRYWGSGRKIKELISKYGKQNFVKEILEEFDDRVAAHKKENQYIEKFRNDDKCLNIACDHKFGTYSNETRTKIGVANAVSLRGKHHTEESKSKISAASAIAKLGEKNPMYGKHLSEEHRAKISAALRGKHRTEETRAKLSAALRGKFCGKHFRKNPITGKHDWYD